MTVKPRKTFGSLSGDLNLAKRKAIKTSKKGTAMAAKPKESVKNRLN